MAAPHNHPHAYPITVPMLQGVLPMAPPDAQLLEQTKDRIVDGMRRTAAVPIKRDSIAPDQSCVPIEILGNSPQHLKGWLTSRGFLGGKRLPPCCNGKANRCGQLGCTVYYLDCETPEAITEPLCAFVPERMREEGKLPHDAVLATLPCLLCRLRETTRLCMEKLLCDAHTSFAVPQEVGIACEERPAQGRFRPEHFLTHTTMPCLSAPIPASFAGLRVRIDPLEGAGGETVTTVDTSAWTRPAASAVIPCTMPAGGAREYLAGILDRYKLTPRTDLVTLPLIHASAEPSSLLDEKLAPKRYGGCLTPVVVDEVWDAYPDAAAVWVRSSFAPLDSSHRLVGCPIATLLVWRVHVLHQMVDKLSALGDERSAAIALALRNFYLYSNAYRYLGMGQEFLFYRALVDLELGNHGISTPDQTLRSLVAPPPCFFQYSLKELGVEVPSRLHAHYSVVARIVVASCRGHIHDLAAKLHPHDLIDLEPVFQALLPSLGIGTVAALSPGKIAIILYVFAAWYIRAHWMLPVPFEPLVTGRDVIETHVANRPLEHTVSFRQPLVSNSCSSKLLTWTPFLENVNTGEDAETPQDKVVQWLSSLPPGLTFKQWATQQVMDALPREPLMRHMPRIWLLPDNVMRAQRRAVDGLVSHCRLYVCPWTGTVACSQRSLSRREIRRTKKAAAATAERNRLHASDPAAAFLHAASSKQRRIRTTKREKCMAIDMAPPTGYGFYEVVENRVHPTRAGVLVIYLVGLAVAVDGIAYVVCCQCGRVMLLAENNACQDYPTRCAHCYDTGRSACLNPFCVPAVYD